VHAEWEGRAQLNIVKRSVTTVPVPPAVAYCVSNVHYSDSKNLVMRKATELVAFKENGVFQQGTNDII
jgi:hypothetical protein